MTRTSPNGRPLRSWSAATRHAAKPITDATDRSISPAMITNVMTMTTITFSIDSSNRFTKLLTLEIPVGLRDVEHERRGQQDRRRAGSSSCAAGPSHASPAIPPIAVWRSLLSCPPSAEALVDDEIEDDRRQDQRTQHGITPELADLGNADQAEIEDLDQDRPEQRTDDRAGPALDAHAPDDGGSDRRQFE